MTHGQEPRKQNLRKHVMAYSPMVDNRGELPGGWETAKTKGGGYLLI